MIYIGADHGGWKRKQQLKQWLEKQGIGMIDVTPQSPKRDDDYPLIASTVAHFVRQQAQGRAILVCRSGVGMAMAANKIAGIRAVQGLDAKTVRSSREEEDSNVLSVSAEHTTWKELQRLVTLWLKTPFKSNTRYRRRLAQLNRLDHGRTLS